MLAYKRCQRRTGKASGSLLKFRSCASLLMEHGEAKPVYCCAATQGKLPCAPLCHARAHDKLRLADPSLRYRQWQPARVRRLSALRKRSVAQPMRPSSTSRPSESSSSTAAPSPAAGPPFGRLGSRAVGGSQKSSSVGALEIQLTAHVGTQLGKVGLLSATSVALAEAAFALFCLLRTMVMFLPEVGSMAVSTSPASMET
mmetsp:Transcript_38884/g.81611  ORF Transcript_38884/g.81611 Transcript_38884/m.81611 type:complete len:200 (+) Transcript_38884:188-787(+)